MVDEVPSRVNGEHHARVPVHERGEAHVRAVYALSTTARDGSHGAEDVQYRHGLLHQQRSRWSDRLHGSTVRRATSRPSIINVPAKWPGGRCGQQHSCQGRPQWTRNRSPSATSAPRSSCLLCSRPAGTSSARCARTRPSGRTRPISSGPRSPPRCLRSPPAVAQVRAAQTIRPRRPARPR